MTPVTKRWMSRANVALAGVTFTCNWGGRDGEWKIISESHAREQLFKGLDYFVCPHHKTAKELGEAVKMDPTWTVRVCS